MSDWLAFGVGVSLHLLARKPESPLAHLIVGYRVGKGEK